MKALFLAIIFWLAATTACYAVPAFDASSTDAVEGVTSTSFNHTVTGANSILNCGFAIIGTTITAAPTFNAVSMTLIDSVSLGGVNLYVYKIVGATGTHAVASNFDGTGNATTTCVSFSGADQVTPTGTAVQDSNTSTRVEATITIPGTGVGVSFGFDATTPCDTHTPDQTSRADVCGASDGGTGAPAAYASSTTTTGSVLMGWTVPNSNYHGLIAFPINAASGVSPKVARRVIRR